MHTASATIVELLLPQRMGGRLSFSRFCQAPDVVNAKASDPRYESGYPEHSGEYLCSKGLIPYLRGYSEKPETRLTSAFLS